jgi:RHS repeat-associated protein
VFATNTTGVKVWTASYDPFGGVRTTTGAPIPARFPGQWFQAESGLHQNWMRDYDPTTGRYLQADPLGLVDGASVYGYAMQSPMMYTDPRGEFGVPGAIAGAIAGGIAGYIISGCWEGAIVGAVAGGAVGFAGGALGTTAVGSGAVTLGGAGAGQIASNLLVSCACGSEPVPTSELITSRRFWINNAAAGLGGGFGSAFGNGIKSAITKNFFGNAPYQGNLLWRTQVLETLVTEGAGGVGAGIGEGLVAGYYSWWR